jgi:internalin A
LNPLLDPLRIARQRIAREAQEQTGWLDLGDLDLAELPDELFHLKHLRSLSLGHVGAFDAQATWRPRPAGDFVPAFSISRIDRLGALPDLRFLSLSGTEVSDLAALKSLAHLQSFDCSDTQVSNLAPLEDLTDLQSFECWNSLVSDLAPLKDLVHLRSVDCALTEVSDLASLQALADLQSLDCSNTGVNDLAPLKGLAHLQSLDCSDTPVSDLAPLKDLADLQSLNCSNTQVSDLAPLKHLTHLQSLNCSSTAVNDLAPLQALVDLRSLDCWYTRVNDLTALKGLANLRSLNCFGTPVSDLAPLKDLAQLQSIGCSNTKVSDLAPLKDLAHLRSIDCSSTEVSDLAPLKNLANLRELDCPSTQVSDLAPLRRLANLQSLVCHRTPVSDLSPLRELVNLQSLHCAGTQVSDLAPLKGLANLQSLGCSDTRVSNLAPLQDLANLRMFDCSGTQVNDLTLLKWLPDLRSLNGSHCDLTETPEEFWFKPSLKELHLYQSRLPHVPSEVLSQEPYDNCLEALRAHLDDLRAGREAVSDVKLMVLGNGLIGKTQICRRLCGEAYDASVASTHGILVRSAPLRRSQDPGGRLQIWDFGGQDIYHGTHALFMRSRAVFMLVWIPQAEDTREYEHGGIAFRNWPLVYWLDYIRQFGGPNSPVIVVQTRCDRPGDGRMPPSHFQTALAMFPFWKVLQYSAEVDRGRGALDDALAEAAAWLVAREGIAEIGTVRSRVKRKLEAMRDAGTPRTISQEQFLGLCRDAGGTGAPEHLLAYLHRAGTVFHRKGLFDDQVIIDQGWALDAIYAVLHREKCLKKLRRQRGRFTRSDLGEWLWDEAGHGAEEQELFLSMMRSCGICFVHRPAQLEKDIEAEYIAPDLLPEKSEIAHELAQKWDAELPGATAEFAYALLPPGLMRALISRLGGAAGLDADYWRDGVYVYEAGTGSRAIVEQTVAEGWQGRIRFAAQRGQAAVLAERLITMLRQEEQRMGITSTVLSLTPAGQPGAGALFNRPKPEVADLIPPAGPAPLAFAQEPASRPEWCVSYAWGDETAEGREREAIVDRLCAAAAARGVAITRDKTTLGLGERISKFMRRVGRGNRVFIVLSEKYLRSPYCMFELCEVWRNCREDDTEFLEHVRVYVVPGTRIWTAHDRAQHAVYWKREYERLAAVVAEHGDEILGEKDAHEYRLMKKFARQIGDILATVADILLPKDFAQLEAYGFSDAVDESRARAV